MSDDFEPSDRTLHDLEHAAQVKAIVEHPVFIEAIEKFRDRLFKLWLNSKPEEREKRETLYLEARAVAAVKEMFGTALTNGRMAQAEIERLAEAKEAQERANLYYEEQTGSVYPRA